MRKYLFPALVIIILTAGCLPVVPSDSPPNEPPTAYIDSISSTRVFEGETVTFSGHGTDKEGTIVAYNWRSSIDGVISTSASFQTSSLSAGKNIVYFKVQDNLGDWSKEIYRGITVIPEGAIEPIVNLFEAHPESIKQGGSIELTWNISGAKTVSIEPGVGDVASVGNRTVVPTTTTSYALTASNEKGSVTVKRKVTVVTIPVRTIETFSIGEEDGHVRSDGKINPDPNVGVTASGVPMQAFLSFDISMVPSGAIIKSSSLDLSNCLTHFSNEIYGNVFGYLGALGVFHDQYGDLDKDDYVTGFHGAMITSYTLPNRPFVSSLLTSAIQKQVDEGSPRFQVRVQFEKPVFFDIQANYLELAPGKPKLVFTYED